jgi:hypothetical protein
MFGPVLPVTASLAALAAIDIGVLVGIVYVLVVVIDVDVAMTPSAAIAPASPPCCAKREARAER